MPAEDDCPPPLSDPEEDNPLPSVPQPEPVEISSEEPVDSTSDEEREPDLLDESTESLHEPGLEEPVEEAEEELQHEEAEVACEDGFWRVGDEDDCVAWTACSEGLEVSIVGSTTSDQVCGQRLIAETVVSEAVDVEEFKAQMATASGDASEVTILITSFEQTSTCATNVPGTVSEYESAAVQTQFRTGVAAALGVDLSAISELTVMDARRRRLLHRLQDGTSIGVTISYDIVITDPAVAAIVAAATEDTATFAVALVEAVNAIDGGGLSLEVSSVTVEAPSITTTIEYDIVVHTADPVAVAAVQTQLADPTVVATALSAATGTVILPTEVVGAITAASSYAHIDQCTH